MADSGTIEYYRAQMRRRLDRVKRRQQNVLRLAQGHSFDAIVIEDDVSHMVLELKHIQYLFGRLAKEVGKATSSKGAYALINQWLARVDAKEGAAWGHIDALRNSEVHVVPMAVQVVHEYRAPFKVGGPPFIRQAIGSTRSRTTARRKGLPWWNSARGLLGWQSGSSTSFTR